MRLAYADPPYPGMAGLYPENTEVDHAALIAKLCEYDGWALSTDERSLRYVLGLCPERVRILAWCRSTAVPYPPFPYAAWEPVICVPARTRGNYPIRSYVETHAATGPAQRQGLTGQKTPGFCEWVIRCLGAEPGDTLDDLFPGTGVMTEIFAAFSQQLSIGPARPNRPSPAAAANMLRRVADPLPGLDSPDRRREAARHVTRRIEENAA